MNLVVRNAKGNNNYRGNHYKCGAAPYVFSFFPILSLSHLIDDGLEDLLGRSNRETTWVFAPPKTVIGIRSCIEFACTECK